MGEANAEAQITPARLPATTTTETHRFDQLRQRRLFEHEVAERLADTAVGTVARLVLDPTVALREPAGRRSAHHP